ncbi:MAG: hypothetical protein F4Z08_01005 [Chloroflexi bacterium]|nr:hypothetical protein [Chloroflexota bacterium]
MRSRLRRLLIAVAVLAFAALSTACAEHDHSTHSHDEADGGAQSGAMPSMSGTHAMVAAVEAPEDMSVSLHVEPDSVSGLNIHLTTTGFTFTPESVNADDDPGTGHAHLYVDGVKITRLYGPYYHLVGVTPGEHEIRVALNTNSHADYIQGTKLVDAVRTVTVPEPGEDGAHAHSGGDVVEAAADMTVAIRVEPDSHSAGGVNVRIDTTGFAFAPLSVNGEHLSGEGHAHIYVDGVKVGRVYGPWYFLGGLAAGEREVRVTLTSNAHQPYVSGDGPVEATVVVVVP